MPPVPILKPEQVIVALSKIGFHFISQKGSHRKYKKGGRTVIIPMHYELARGTLASILVQAGVTIGELMKHIK
ncbi:MAG: type II toxin-antitoxin system HicA family toxin [Syntrophomonadaceae bacterium]|jgi:predicted RNA binding protein YcfA (HicA-like mRNA interferase family)|nr:type II toxin-antitoxin system HicA family toxin [Syntrophomonadaceae bacterium]